jgi:hypothetical protein
MLNRTGAEDKSTSTQVSAMGEVLEQNEEAEMMSVWETARRRSRHHRHTAALTCTQGKRRQLRGLWGRSR